MQLLHCSRHTTKLKSNDHLRAIKNEEDYNDNQLKNNIMRRVAEGHWKLVKMKKKRLNVTNNDFKQESADVL